MRNSFKAEGHDAAVMWAIGDGALQCEWESEMAVLAQFQNNLRRSPTTTLPCPQEEKKSRSQSFLSSLQSSTTYWAMDNSTPTTDSQIQVYQESANIAVTESLPQSIQMPVMYFSQHMPIMHPSHQSQQMPMIYFSQQVPIMHSMQYLQHPATEQIPFIGVTDSSSHSVEMPVHSSQHVHSSSTSATQEMIHAPLIKMMLLSIQVPMMNMGLHFSWCERRTNLIQADAND
ncbi:hypothetical protein MRB53_018636 [Persea americana]|uniref:Uncharacterized protein n=1 Tax=Persea americana TaxID=3435 RepID=A0ACC2M9V7_PERAE|nr:hypothetical protein MRB53_018636 [Persea americana]